EHGIRIDELFLQNVTGILTMGDNFIVNEDKQVIADRVQKLANGEYDEDSLNHDFGLGKNYAKFVLNNHDLLDFDEAKLTKLSYRLFDERWTYFDNKVIWRWREKVMMQMVRDNTAICFCRQLVSSDFSHIFLSNCITDDSYLSNKSRER